MRQPAVAAGIAFCLLAVLGGTTAAALTSPNYRDVKLPDKPRRAQLITDGVFTVGQAETITVAKMLRKVKVSVTVEPDGPECSSIEVACFDAQTHPAPGTRFRTNARGQAMLSFVMPSSYRQFREPDLTLPSVAFTNGQPVTLFASAMHRRGRGPRSKLLWTGARAGGIVEVPPAP